MYSIKSLSCFTTTERCTSYSKSLRFISTKLHLEHASDEGVAMAHNMLVKNGFKWRANTRLDTLEQYNKLLVKHNEINGMEERIQQQFVVYISWTDWGWAHDGIFSTWHWKQYISSKILHCITAKYFGVCCKLYRIFVKKYCFQCHLGVLSKIVCVTTIQSNSNERY